MLLVLDIDETLLYSTTKRLTYVPDYLVGENYVYARPGLKEFLDAISHGFRVAVWTSAVRGYAERLVTHYFPEALSLQFLWARDRCTRQVDRKTKETYWLKDLKKIKSFGYSLDEILMIDDRPCKTERYEDNHVLVTPFVGQQEDRELEVLTRYLATIKEVQNVRVLEKRNWRLKVKTTQ